MFVHAINMARERFWIASPYFVPDGQVLSAMKLAALRGVDVRILTPEKPDHRTVHLASLFLLRKYASIWHQAASLYRRIYASESFSC